MIEIDPTEPRVVAFNDARTTLRKITKDLQAERRREAQLTEEYRGARLARRSGLEGEAAVLLGERIEPTQAPSAEGLAGVRHRVAVLEVAIQRQREIVDAKRRDFSRYAHEQARGRFVEVATQLRDSLLRLAHANEAENELFNELLALDVGQVLFDSLAVSPVGCTTDAQSLCSIRLHEIENVLAKNQGAHG